MKDAQMLHINIADTFTKRFIGLMFKRSIHNKGIMLSPCNSVHMFFMRFPIDIIFVNGDGRILLSIKELKPWRVSPIVKNSSHVIEMPCGSIERYNLYKGTSIVIPKNKKNFFISIKNDKNKNKNHL
ncbi:hypothetical protein B4U37_07485 [Sutcliffiella horikoshii]|uniref:DUF192 domain-containing protein n=1 Tax=Sutcliffiella horikoshii TaxID=79883 RepID=A0ABM6KHY5_9BACI|nr:DUF192 domain-containing protein [Sutcliffiella horikoshii]ART75880.1 hypothetical protein B4U37_07485 [Sutcliffiella horikoshii]